jgi:DNA ligase (NAD+)
MNTSIRYRLRNLAICAIALLTVSPLPIYSASERAALPTPVKASLEGKIIVLAGRLPALTAAEAKSLIEQGGGTVATRVTSTTHYLVAGSRPGANAEKARTLGIPVVDEAELRRMLGIPEAVARNKRPK